MRSKEGTKPARPPLPSTSFGRLSIIQNAMNVVDQNAFCTVNWRDHRKIRHVKDQVDPLLTIARINKSLPLTLRSITKKSEKTPHGYF